MRLEELRKHLHRHPFIPIRIFVSGGKSYDVMHPDFMLVSRAEVVIGLDPGTDQIPERNAFIDPVHITRVEPVNGRRGKSKRRHPHGD